MRALKRPSIPEKAAGIGGALRRGCWLITADDWLVMMATFHALQPHVGTIAQLKNHRLALRGIEGVVA